MTSADRPDAPEGRSNAELGEATAAGLRWITVARIGMELVVLGSMVVLAHLIPPAAFGVFALSVIVQELAVTIPGEGIGSALVQRKELRRDHLQAGFAMSLVSGVALAALSLLLAQVVVRPLYDDQTASYVMLATPWFLLGAIVALPVSVLRRRLDFRRLALLDLTQSLVRAGASIVLATAFGLDAGALVFGGLAGLCAVVPLALVFAPVPLPRWRGDAARDLLPYSGPAALACVAWAGFRNGDYAIVGARLGAAQAGFYWRGFQLGVEYQRKISTVMTQIAFPVLARTAGQEEMFVLRRRMVRLLSIVVFPLLALLVILAPVVIPFVFGPTWEPAVLPTQILAGAGAATVIIDAVGSVLMAAGRAGSLLLYGVAHFAVYVTAVLAASSHGLVAVSAVAVAVHFVFLLVAYKLLLRGRSESTLRFLWSDVGAATVAAAALVTVSWPAAAALRDAGVPALAEAALVGALGGGVYLVTLKLWFKEASADLMAMIRRVLPSSPVGATVRRIPILAGRSS